MRTQLFGACLLAYTKAIYYQGKLDQYIVDYEKNAFGKWWPEPHYVYDGEFKYVFPLRPEVNWGRCTATMIGPRVALTAAHCVADSSGVHYDVYKGMEVNVEGETYEIADVIVPECFDFYDWELLKWDNLKVASDDWDRRAYDIALLVLD